MRKKLLCFSLVVALAFSSFAGCGKKEEKKEVYKPVLPTAVEEAEIFVAPIEGISDDFIRGMDISSVLTQEAAGVKYYNEKGEEEDLFKILADSGVNYIRVRVWNDPFDKDGHGYGGGNCDAKVAAEIGKRAAAYGMKLLVDFHYSDFWADPAKQMCPKAWEGMTLDEKVDAISKYTTESLNSIIEAGADVGMVQIGNEINNGMSGETVVKNVCTLLQSASSAVRAVAKEKKLDIKIVAHYTQLDDPKCIDNKAKDLKTYEVDYDIFGVSYYPFWHGTIENMKEVLTHVKNDYGKDVCIMETSYCFTDEDGDFSGNSVSAGDCWEEYPVSVQGQAMIIRDIMAAANEIGALGVFYWEGAWTPVGNDYEANKEKWEKYGAGWASSYAGAYDPKDAGQYWGGSSWDNQAFFDANSKKLASLDVFKYVKYGSTAPIEAMKYFDADVIVDLHGEVVLPDSVQTIYNDPSVTTPSKVTWNEQDIAAIDTDTIGDYVVSGQTENGTEVKANVKVTSVNYVKNSSFEDGEEPWTVTYPNGTECTDLQNKAGDAVSGNYAYHYWTDKAEVEFQLEQVISKDDISKTGAYRLKANIQGGDMGSAESVYAYVKIGDQVYKSDEVKLEGWVVWKELVVEVPNVDLSSDITIGIYVKGDSGSWGTIDDVEFCSMN